MKISEKIYDITTGEETIVERDETAVEKKAREKFEADLVKAQAEAEAKAVARQAIADRLGLTADELQVLLG
jgi:hypothetical protein